MHDRERCSCLASLNSGLRLPSIDADADNRLFPEFEVSMTLGSPIEYGDAVFVCDNPIVAAAGTGRRRIILRKPRMEPLNGQNECEANDGHSNRR